jgi:uncharacterized protein YoxC
MDELTLARITAFAFLLLLVVVAVGVYQIMNALQGINRVMAKISWGVRAIEGETDLITSQVPPLIETFTVIDEGAKIIATRLSSAERNLAAAGQLLGVGKG